MIDNLLADAFNGFSLNDLPFLLIQLGVSAITVWILRMYWMKIPMENEEAWLARFILPLQVVFTLLAVFSQRSPWVAMVFGLSLVIIAFSGNQLSLRSRVFFTLSMVAAWGFGSGNLLVTLLVYVLIVWPLVHMAAANKK